MRAVKLSERDIQRFVMGACHYILVPEEELYAGEDVLAVSENEEGVYRFHITDSMRVRCAFSSFSICTIEKFKVIK